MENKDTVIQELFTRIEQLTRQQKVFQDEINKLHQDIHKLNASPDHDTSSNEVISSHALPGEKAERFLTEQKVSSATKAVHSQTGTTKRAWEEFIGVNLMNKIGIAVLVLGIGFGTKYSIDNELITPQTRIILGYLAGVALIGIGMFLRARHAGFSAVLLSGGMAVLYFITYAAHGYYGLISQAPAFVLMVLFTVLTVAASLRYDQEVISIMALVGAYAVPLLLSDGSGRVMVLFSYITIINAGVLVLSFKKYWKGLFYLSFIFTWLGFASWHAFSPESGQLVTLSLVFSTIFFVTFYITFLAYKLLRRESLNRGDIVCMLANSFVFYGYGYLTLESLSNGEQYLGMFTLLTALVHFVACLVIYRTQARLNDIFYFVAGMMLVFLTIAVPVQLDGNWVTLLWAGEAALMFWIGRSKSFPAYEKLSYPLIALAFISLMHDWGETYPGFNSYTNGQIADFRIFLNVQFLTSMIVGGALLFILRITRLHPDAKVFRAGSEVSGIFKDALPVLTLIVLYMGFYKEIQFYWYNQYAGSRISVQGSEGIVYDQYNQSLLSLKNIWLIIFSAVFAGLLCLFVQTKWLTRKTALACLGINTIVLLSFIALGLWELRVLRRDFLAQDLAELYERGYGLVFIRYVAIVAMLPLLWFNGKLVRHEFFSEDLRKAAHLYFHFVVLALLSSELIHWLDISRVENSFKLSLSILWGAYALFLIVYGLSRDLKHIRLGAMVLFAITLLKLFAYDMSGMSTILKTVVMIILGTLLLTASFVYNKFKRSAGNEV